MKEHAYIYDLYVVPRWRDLFDSMYREHLELPSEGRVLELNCGTGGWALELAGSVGERGEVWALDTTALLELAEAKRAVTKQQNIRFRPLSELDELQSGFDLIVIDLTLLPLSREQLLRALGLLSRGGRLVMKYLSRGSFDEFYSVFWEALFDCGMADEYLSRLEGLINRYATLEEMELYLKRAQMRSIRNYQQKEEFSFKNARDFLDSPLIKGYFLEGWLSILDSEAAVRVFQSLQEVIDREAGFEVSIKANLITCVR